MIWIVTVHEQYYPVAGTSDWRLVTKDEAEAREFFQSLELGWNQQTYLICIVTNPRDGKTTATEVEWRGYQP